jgi:hypothetical protein
LALKTHFNLQFIKLDFFIVFVFLNSILIHNFIFVIFKFLILKGERSFCWIPVWREKVVILIYFGHQIN